jgi:hypothetical protein
VGRRSRAEIEKRMLHSADRPLAIRHKHKTRGLVEGTLRICITPAGMNLLESVNSDFEATTAALVGWVDADTTRGAVEVLDMIRGSPPPA